MEAERPMYPTPACGKLGCQAWALVPQLQASEAALATSEARVARLEEAGNSVSAYVYGRQNPGTIPIHVRMAMQVFEDYQAEKARARRAALAEAPEQPTVAEGERGMGHAFIPLSGSQDTGGNYTRCAVNGCTRPAVEHRNG